MLGGGGVIQELCMVSSFLDEVHLSLSLLISGAQVAPALKSSIVCSRINSDLWILPDLRHCFVPDMAVAEVT